MYILAMPHCLALLRLCVQLATGIYKHKLLQVSLIYKLLKIIFILT